MDRSGGRGGGGLCIAQGGRFIAAPNRKLPSSQFEAESSFDLVREMRAFQNSGAISKHP